MVAAARPASGPEVLVAIPTCRRPRALARGLDALSRIDVPADCTVEVLVCDNDTDRSAEALVRELARSFRFPLHYAVEDVQGLASVRNRILSEAGDRRARWLAGFDDDEQPSTGWLTAYLDARRHFEVPILTGPVRPIDENGQPLAFHQKYRDGAEPRRVAGNNFMVDVSALRATGERFDPRFDFIGGEDFDFFYRLRAAGLRAVWVSRALVEETVPAARVSLAYLVFRNYTGAMNNVVFYRKYHGALDTLAHFVVKATGKALGAVTGMCAAIVTLNLTRSRKALARAATAAGYVAALAGFRRERYRPPD